MTRRLIKLKAHIFTTIAGAWLLFSAFAFWDWKNANRYLDDPNAIVDYVIWYLQIFFISLAVYFHKKETPREALWFGAATAHASGFIPSTDLKTALKEIALIVPELTDAEIEKLAISAKQISAEDEITREIPLTSRGREETFSLSIELWEDNELYIYISTSRDLAVKIKAILSRYERE